MSNPIESRWVLGQRIDFILDGTTTGRKYALFDMYVPAIFAGPPPHTHNDCDESFYILEGTIEFLVNNTWHARRAGEFAYVPKGAIHTFRNVSGQSARAIVTVSPAGFERFFRDFGTPTTRDSITPPPVPPEIIQRLLAEAQSYGMTLHLK